MNDFYELISGIGMGRFVLEVALYTAYLMEEIFVSYQLSNNLRIILKRSIETRDSRLKHKTSCNLLSKMKWSGLFGEKKRTKEKILELAKPNYAVNNAIQLIRYNATVEEKKRTRKICRNTE